MKKANDFDRANDRANTEIFGDHPIANKIINLEIDRSRKKDRRGTENVIQNKVRLNKCCK